MKEDIYHRLTPEDIQLIKETWLQDTSQSDRKVYQRLKGRVNFSLRSLQRVLTKVRPRWDIIPLETFVEPWGEGWPTDPEGTAVAVNLIEIANLINDFAWFRPTTRELRWAIRLHRLFNIFNRELEKPGMISQRLLSVFYLWYMSRLYARRERASDVFPDQSRVGLYDDLDKLLHSRIWERYISTESEVSLAPTPLVVRYVQSLIGNAKLLEAVQDLAQPQHRFVTKASIIEIDNDPTTVAFRNIRLDDWVLRLELELARPFAEWAERDSSGRLESG